MPETSHLNRDSNRGYVVSRSGGEGKKLVSAGNLIYFIRRQSLHRQTCLLLLASVVDLVDL